MTSTWVHEGSYALEHTGTASDAVSEAMELEKDITYYVTAYVRPETADSKIKISFAGRPWNPRAAASGRSFPPLF